MKRFLAAALLFTSAAPAAADDCRLATPAAIICTSARNAAVAWGNFRTRLDKVNPGFLRAYGCTTAHRASAYPAQPVGHHPVALPFTSVDVTATELQGGLWYVASAFLAGNCKAVVKRPDHPDYVMPDMAAPER